MRRMVDRGVAVHRRLAPGHSALFPGRIRAVERLRPDVAAGARRRRATEDPRTAVRSLPVLGAMCWRLETVCRALRSRRDRAGRGRTSLAGRSPVARPRGPAGVVRRRAPVAPPASAGRARRRAASAETPARAADGCRWCNRSPPGCCASRCSARGRKHNGSREPSRTFPDSHWWASRRHICSIAMPGHLRA